MESQKTQIKDAAQQLNQPIDKATSNEQPQPVKKSRKFRPFAVMAC
ncbi:MAG: hypothetical protein F6J92_40295 [Symploca sp. SIO1A3]|nr:hypothetical protein [Symploca sp. SIO1A3]